MSPPCRSLGIAGLGLIGGSIALGVRNRWPSVRITGFDRPDHAAEGRRRGLIDEVASDAGQLAGCDLVVLAVPLAAMSGVIETVAAARPQGVVTDVGSAKRQVLEQAARSGLSGFVGGHPMAGAERAGLAHARADLFAGRPWLLASGAPATAAALVEEFARGLGAGPRWMTADVHDRMMAYVSHLPQLIATTLMNAARDAVGAEGLACAGPAFAEMTRLASSSSDVWQGILAQNADFAAEALARFIDLLPSEGDLQSAAWVAEAFARAGTARRDLPARPSDRHE